MRYTHGGDVTGYLERFGRQPLDFSANINPLGLPAPVRDAMRDAVDGCTRYPDPFCRALRRGLSARWELPENSFFCGNGAAEIFFRLAAVLRPKTALLLAPTFGEYEAALGQAGCALRFHALDADEDFALTTRFLDDLTDDVEAVFLCNPNNPTGSTAPPALLAQIVRRCRQIGAWLVVDECFGDFLENAETHTLRPFLDEYDRLVLVRAFTKLYAIPGARLGFCMSRNTALMDALHAAGQPWNVSVIAQAAGEAALGMEDYAAKTAAFVAARRGELSPALAALGLRVFPSEVNYLLFRSRCADLPARLLPRGVMVRDCANFRALEAGYCRVAVRGREENARLVQALREVL